MSRLPAGSKGTSSPLRPRPPTPITKSDLEINQRFFEASVRGDIRMINVAWTEETSYVHSSYVRPKRRRRLIQGRSTISAVFMKQVAIDSTAECQRFQSWEKSGRRSTGDGTSPVKSGFERRRRRRRFRQFLQHRHPSKWSYTVPPQVRRDCAGKLGRRLTVPGAARPAIGPWRPRQA